MNTCRRLAHTLSAVAIVCACVARWAECKLQVLNEKFIFLQAVAPVCWFSKGATNNFGFCRLRTRRTRNGGSMCIEACCEWVRSTLLCLHNFFCFSSSFIFAQNALRREFSIAARAQHRGMRFLLRRKGEGKTRIRRFSSRHSKP